VDSKDFLRMRDAFSSADVDGKIDIYVSAEGLSPNQYRELLKMFPMKEMHRLEEALG